MKKSVLQIGGMTCIDCAKTIEKALNNREGVYNATLNFATEKVAVEYNPEQTSEAGIKKTIKEAGYQVVEPKKRRKILENKERQTTH